MKLPIGAFYWRLVLDQGYFTPDVLQHSYPGDGTKYDPYVVDWIENDTRDPHNLAAWKKWGITVVTSLVTLISAMISSAYVGALDQILGRFPVGFEIATLGISLFVLGKDITPSARSPKNNF